MSIGGRFLSDIQGRWPFLLINQVLFLLAIQGGIVWLGLIAMLVFLRIASLSKGQACLNVFLLGMTFASFVFGQYQAAKVKELPVEDQSFQLQITYQPYENYRRSDYLQGQEVVSIEGREVKVQWSYFIKEAIDWELDRPQTLRVKGKMKRPESARNFHVFDYQEYLASQNIYWVYLIEEVAEVEPADGSILEQCRWMILDRLYCQRDSIWLGFHQKLIWNMNAEVYQSHRDLLAGLGILHFFAISGFHVHYLKELIRIGLLRLGLAQDYLPWLLGLFILIYGYLIAWPLGMVRVTLMTLARKLVDFFDLPLSPLDTYAALLVAVLIFKPSLISSLAFALSYGITFLLKIYRPLSHGPRWRSLELTLLCLLYTWPITLSLNFQINGLQVLLVCLAGLVFERIIMPIMLLTTGLVLSLGPDSHFFVWLDECLQLFPWDFSKLIGVFTFTVGSPSQEQVFLLLMLLVIFIIYFHKYPIQVGGLLLLVYTSVLIFGFQISLGDRMTILDVGQGDSFLYQPGLSRQAWLVDTGGRYQYSSGDIDSKFAQKNLLPSLKALGVARITGLVITHPDIDHIGNLVSLLETIPVQHIYVSSYTYQDSMFQSNLNLIKAKGCQVHIIPPNSHLAISQQIQIISLKDSGVDYLEDESNNSSLLTYFQTQSFSLLAMGDLAMSMEDDLLLSYPNIETDFLKVGHHGSRRSTSSALLKDFKVGAALISAGPNNRYGHPHPELKKRLDDLEIPSWSTDQYGAIQLLGKSGSQVYIETCLYPKGDPQ